MPSSPLEKTVRFLVMNASHRDAKRFLEDVMAEEELDLETRIDAARLLLPYQHPRLHAVLTANTKGSATFEQWLERLEGPAKQLMENGLKRIANGNVIDIEDEPAGTA
jgi:hypothetical protein